MDEKRPRGRPRGSAPTRNQDEPFLRAAAQRVFLGLAPTATSAFRSLLDPNKDDYSTRLRRLQLRWQHVGEAYLQEVPVLLQQKHWDHELRGLTENQPELANTVRTFVASPVGQAVLAGFQKDGQPLHPMAFGIVRLWELIESHSAVGTGRADEMFEAALASWSATGLGPDEAFLRRFAHRCLQRADEIAADRISQDGSGDNQ